MLFAATTKNILLTFIAQCNKVQLATGRCSLHCGDTNCECFFFLPSEFVVSSCFLWVHEVVSSTFESRYKVQGWWWATVLCFTDTWACCLLCTLLWQIFWPRCNIPISTFLDMNLLSWSNCKLQPTTMHIFWSPYENCCVWSWAKDMMTNCRSKVEFL
jgi:hypothetical protein